MFSTVLDEKDEIATILKQDILMIKKIFSADEKESSLKELESSFLSFVKESNNEFSYFIQLIDHYAEVRFNHTKIATLLTNTLLTAMIRRSSLKIIFIRSPMLYT